jgi:hypothetical protein
MGGSKGTAKVFGSRILMAYLAAVPPPGGFEPEWIWDMENP